MDIIEIQKKFSDNRNKKFKRLYLCKDEIKDLKNQNFSIRQIQKIILKNYRLKISTGSLHSFIKNCL